VPRREFASVGRAAGLDQHGVPLGAARQIERAIDAEVFAAMVDAMHFRGVDETAARLVADKGVVFPAIPQRLHHLGELGCALVALRMIGHRLAPKIAG
jgi:hypothetical protein